MPRFNQFSVNRSYFSWLMGKKEYVIDARIKGGERHMIMSNEYDRVFPMDIFPEYLVKAIIAGDIDRMEALGIYEVAPEDFALCDSYVLPKWKCSASYVQDSICFVPKWHNRGRMANRKIVNRKIVNILMKALRNYLDKIKPNFEEGGKFHAFSFGVRRLRNILVRA